MKSYKKRKLRIASGLFIGVTILLSPVVASAATQPASTIVDALVGEAISITTSSTVAISITPTAGGALSSSNDTITVNTNNPSGYTLTLANSDASLNLVSGGNTIQAHSGTQASPSSMTSNRWGYAVAGVGGFDGSYAAETNNTSSTSTWAGVPASGTPITLKATATTASNDTTTVWYGVKATSAQPNGTYSDTVTYTATTN